MKNDKLKGSIKSNLKNKPDVILIKPLEDTALSSEEYYKAIDDYESKGHTVEIFGSLSTDKAEEILEIMKAGSGNFERPKDERSKVTERIIKSVKKNNYNTL